LTLTFVTAQRLQQVLGQRDSQEQVKHDRMVNKLSQTLNNALSSKLEKCVREEIHKTVVPCEFIFL
jgi:L-asparaginase/Glu-tRNA(Gln) amidotransferase subunit D